MPVNGARPGFWGKGNKKNLGQYQQELKVEKNDRAEAIVKEENSFYALLLNKQTERFKCFCTDMMFHTLSITAGNFRADTKH